MTKGFAGCGGTVRQGAMVLVRRLQLILALGALAFALVAPVADLQAGHGPETMMAQDCETGGDCAPDDACMADMACACLSCAVVIPVSGPVQAQPTSERALPSRVAQVEGRALSAPGREPPPPRA